MTLQKATLTVIDFNTSQPSTDPNLKVEAQFNPQTLQVTYRNVGPDGATVDLRQSSTQGAPLQQTGYLADLSVDLLFDTTTTGDDVRNITVKIVRMIKGDKKPDNQQSQSSTSAPPRQLVQICWGTFLFNGSVQSVTETLEFFSEDGVPLRSSVKIGLNGVELDRTNPSAFAGLGLSLSIGVGIGGGIGFSASASLNAGISVGTTPLTLAKAGDTLQGLAGRANVDWKSIASANNIDNPRMVPPGTILNLNAGAGVGG
jgi:hypothetical protein